MNELSKALVYSGGRACVHVLQTYIGDAVTGAGLFQGCIFDFVSETISSCKVNTHVLLPLLGKGSAGSEREHGQTAIARQSQ